MLWTAVVAAHITATVHGYYCDFGMAFASRHHNGLRTIFVSESYRRQQNRRHQ